jgi:ketosteroid isomerase-like protein
MRRAFLAAGVALVAALALPLAPSTVHAADRKADEAELTKLSNNWDKVIVAKQEKAIADNMAEDFRIIDGHGNVENKAQFVAGVMDTKLTIDPYKVDDFEIRLYGDVALLSGHTLMTGIYDGEKFTSNYRYIDIYVKRGGAWKIVSVQITRYPPKEAPAQKPAK